MTTQWLIDLAIHAADQIDAEQPTLRASGARADVRGLPPSVPVWLMYVAARANRLGRMALFGLKTAGGGRPLSYDTLGINREGLAFDAVSVCRDGEGYPRRLIDYGTVGAPQQWYAVPAEPAPDPSEPTEPVPEPTEPTEPTEPPAPSPEIAALTARVEALERQNQYFLHTITMLTKRIDECNPAEWEAAGKIGWWGVTLPLRRKSRP